MKAKEEEITTEETSTTNEGKINNETTEENALKVLEEKNAALNDQYLRLYADFENYKKRAQKEKMDLLLNASENSIKKILPVVDDLERSLKVHENEGTQLIYQKLIQILQSQGLQVIENGTGKAFDLNTQEAISQIAANNEEEKGIVIDEVEKGYLLNGKVIRFSKVIVAQ